MYWQEKIAQRAWGTKPGVTRLLNPTVAATPFSQETAGSEETEEDSSTAWRSRKEIFLWGQKKALMTQRRQVLTGAPREPAALGLPIAQKGNSTANALRRSGQYPTPPQKPPGW